MSGTQVTTSEFTILVIEDDVDMNELISAILNTAGYSVLACEDGRCGLEKAREHKPDLILLDIMLPEVDGIEVCRLLTDDPKTKHIPVIMLTLKRELSVKLSSYIAGAKRFMTKPFGVEDLLSQVKNTLMQPHNSLKVKPELEEDSPADRMY